MGPSAEPRINVGYVRRAHGLRGEVIVRPLSDNPDRYLPGRVLVTDEVPPRRLEVIDARPHADGLLVRFVGVSDRVEADRLRGVTFTIGAGDRRNLEEGEYWPEDLEGLGVIDRSGARLGTVIAVVLGEAQDRLVVRTDEGREVEVPFVDQIVGAIHPSGGFLVVDPPDGLF